MKILITSDFYIPTVNGVVTSIVNLKSGLEKRGHEVRILTVSQTSKSYYEDGVYYIGSFSVQRIYPSARLSRRSIHKEKKEILEWGPDIVHSQNEFCTFYIVKKILKRTQVPIVNTYHTVYGDYTHYFFRCKRLGLAAVYICSKLLGKNVNCIIAPTEKIKRILNGFNVACPVHVIPSGIALDKFNCRIPDNIIRNLRKQLNIPEKNFLLLAVSRLGKEKNLEELILHIHQLKEQKVTLIIVGDGPEKKKLEKLIIEMKLVDNIKLIGMVSPQLVPWYYQMSDVFVSTSTSESQGLTYIEALASGLPILCKKDECLDGILEEGINGYYFSNTEDFLQQLEKCIVEKKKTELSRNSYGMVERFSIEKFVENIESLYKVLIY